MQPPGLLQSLEEQIRAAKKKNLRRRSIPASQSRKILVNDGLKKRRDDFIDGHSGFQQSVGVGFSEDAALAADFVQRVTGVTHFSKPFGRNLQFARRLFD